MAFVDVKGETTMLFVLLIVDTRVIPVIFVEVSVSALLMAIVFDPGERLAPTGKVTIGVKEV